MFDVPMGRWRPACGPSRCSGSSCRAWHGLVGWRSSAPCPQSWRSATACSSACALSGEPPDGRRQQRAFGPNERVRRLFAEKAGRSVKPMNIDPSRIRVAVVGARWRARHAPPACAAQAWTSPTMSTGLGARPSRTTGRKQHFKLVCRLPTLHRNTSDGITPKSIADAKPVPCSILKTASTAVRPGGSQRSVWASAATGSAAVVSKRLGTPATNSPITWRRRSRRSMPYPNLRLRPSEHGSARTPANR